MESAEKASPGQLDEATANNVLATARDLGTTINESYYPTERSPPRGLVQRGRPVLVLAPMGVWSGHGPARPQPHGGVIPVVTLVSTIHKMLYIGSGMAGFVIGIGLEIYGFSQRVMITGWAPVSNMYETVIWVALVTAVLGSGL